MKKSNDYVDEIDCFVNLDGSAVYINEIVERIQKDTVKATLIYFQELGYIPQEKDIEIELNRNLLNDS